MASASSTDWGRKGPSADWEGWMVDGWTLLWVMPLIGTAIVMFAVWLPPQIDRLHNRLSRRKR